nr:hypothetical protein [uncultured Campylobacter sp.]
MRTLFESFGLGSPAPYERAFAPFSCGFALKNWHKTRSNATATVLHG